MGQALEVSESDWILRRRYSVTVYLYGTKTLSVWRGKFHEVYLWLGRCYGARDEGEERTGGVG